MIECYKSNLDDVGPVQDFLLKPNLPSQIDPGDLIGYTRKGKESEKSKPLDFMRIFMN